jgi:hypothetical protein
MFLNLNSEKFKKPAFQYHSFQHEIDNLKSKRIQIPDLKWISGANPEEII